MGGDAHDGTGAVGEESVVGDEDGDLFSVQPVGAVGSDEYSRLLLVRRHPLYLGAPPRLLDVGLHLFLFFRSSELGNQGVLGSENHEGYAEHGVGGGW